MKTRPDEQSKGSSLRAAEMSWYTRTKVDFITSKLFSVNDLSISSDVG